MNRKCNKGRRPPRRPSRAQPVRRPPRARVVFDWTHIAAPENHRAFEHLASEIFDREFDSTLFTPNAIRFGKDGGADGSYNGTISGIKGPWKISAATRKDLANLEAKIREENRLAKKKGFRGLFFITPFDVTPTEVKRLEAIAGKGLKKAIMWARGRLDYLVRKYPWLATYHFGHQIIPGFVPVDHPGERDLASQADVPLVGRQKECSEARAFLGSQDPILVLVAPGGWGKSRMLREFGSITHSVRPRRSAWLRRVGQGTIEDSIGSGLPISTPMLVCLDDAGQALGEVRELTRFATDGRLNINVKLVFAAREVDRGVVLGALGSARARTRVVSLAEIESGARLAILSRDCPGLSRKEAVRLANLYGKNLFLLREAARLVREGESPRTLVNIEHLRDLIAGRFVKEAKKLLEPIAPGHSTEQILLDTSVDVPFSRNQEADAAIATLKEAGLLRPVGNTLRFRADVEGDLLLAYLLEQPWARQRVRRLLATNPDHLPARARNLSAAGETHAAEILRDLCQDWLGSIATMDRRAQSLVLDAMPYCARSAPAEVTDLCRAVAQLPDFTTDELGPIVLALARSHGPTRALSAAREMGYATVPEGMYSNYKIAQLGDSIVDLEHLRLHHVRAVCDLIVRWIVAAASDDDAATCAALIQTATTPMLRMVIRVEESDAVTLTLGERPLGATRAVREMRLRALTIIESLLKHPLRAFRVVGAKLVHEHIRGEGNMVSSDALVPFLAKELGRLSPTFANLLTSETDCEVRYLLEQELFLLWAMERPGDEIAARILRQAPFSAANRAFALVVEPWEWRYDLREVLDAAPTTDRWLWWIHQKYFPPASEVDRLIDALQSSHRTPDLVLKLVDELPRNGQVFNLLDPWCERALDLLDRAAALAPSTPAGKVLAQTVARHRRKVNPKIIIEEARDALNAADRNRLLELVGEARLLPSAVVAEFARLLVEADDVLLRAQSLVLVRFRDDLPTAEVRAILLRALRDGTWTSYFDSIWSAVRDLAKQAGNPESVAADVDLVDLIKARLAEAALGEPWNRHEGWHVARLFDLIFAKDDIQSRLGYVDALLPFAGGGSRDLAKQCLGPIIKTETSLRDLAFAGCGWVRAKKLEDVGTLASLIDDATGREAMPQHAKNVAMELVAQTTIEEKELGLSILSSLRADADACATIADYAARPGPLQESAAQLLNRFTLPRRSYSRGIGEPSPAILSLKSTLQVAQTIVTEPGAVVLLRGMQSVIDQLLAYEVRRDEEILDPR
jgi:hypothetical protein